MSGIALRLSVADAHRLLAALDMHVDELREEAAARRRALKSGRSAKPGRALAWEAGWRERSAEELEPIFWRLTDALTSPAVIDLTDRRAPGCEVDACGCSCHGSVAALSVVR